MSKKELKQAVLGLFAVCAVVGLFAWIFGGLGLIFSGCLGVGLLAD